MIKIEILSVRSPKWANEDGSAINCLVRTNTLMQETPFTATPCDSEARSILIVTRQELIRKFHDDNELTTDYFLSNFEINKSA
ncbi:hypothetical protein HA520_07475 [Azotobacter chroococcum]|uniref:Uncharacterized protein n=1 Tax=Azotobacter chroococcum TaxID=353 RepID=A0AA44C825_9GAMM|nr:hypothetical protein [Azotobacter chroococcum]NHN77133.1 hypothetical protein [Azotobacter chroococcum]